MNRLRSWAANVRDAVRSSLGSTLGTPHSNSERAVRAAARRVGIWVAVASGLITAAGIGIMSLIVLVNSQPHDRDDRPALPDGVPRGGDEHLVVDTGRTLLWLLILGAIGIVVLGIIGWFASRRSTRPLSQAFRLQRNFVADASHELRTPLTVLSARAQILERRLAPDDPAKAIAHELQEDARSMAETINDLLLSAEGEDHRPEEPIDVGRVVADAVAALAPLAEPRKVLVEVTQAEPAAIRIPEVSLRRCVVALVDNAIGHSPADGRVTVAISTALRTVTIDVSDQGEGITGVDIERIFERFAHSDTPGVRRGFGLGLALVRDVALRYRGTISVASSSSKGTTMRLTLPLS